MQMDYQPELIDYLYTHSSVLEILDAYISDLETYNTLSSIQHAQKLKEYRDKYVKDRRFLSQIRNLFNKLHDLLDRKSPTLRFIIEGRRKSLIKTEQKILLYQELNKPLDLLRDMIAFRIIIFGKDCPELIKEIYRVLEFCSELCIVKGFSICESTQIPKNSFSFENAKINGIVIPQTEIISPEYRYCIKDYIRYPKSNGYQSVHAIFRAPDGRCFELQCRTMDMHIRAETGDASHLNHDIEKYANNGIDFDPARVDMEGFYYSKEDNKLLDYIGLYKSSQILQRRKSF